MVVLQLDGQQVIDIGEEVSGELLKAVVLQGGGGDVLQVGQHAERQLPSSSCSALVWRDSSCSSTSP